MVMRDIVLRNAESMGQGLILANPLLDAISAEQNEAIKNYEHLRNYWNGDHMVRLTDRLIQFLRANGFTNYGDPQSRGYGSFSDNFCGIVISSLVDRLHVAAFTVPGEEPGAPEAEGGPATAGPAAAMMKRWQELNRFEALQLEVHEMAAALGDAYVFTEWDPELGYPVFYVNSPEHIRVWRDDRKRIVRAAKRWVVLEPRDGTNEQLGSVRMNVYYPDRVEKYVSRVSDLNAATGWVRYEEVDEPWPLPHVDPKTGRPLGVQIAHFRNDARGGDYGRSELGDAIPLQDAVNKALVDGVKIQDTLGWPQRWGTGVEAAPDAAIQTQPGSVWTVPSPDARWGEFNAADPAKAVLWLEHLIETISTVTSTPGYMFRSGGDKPSGEALKVADAPLVKKSKARQTSFADPWEDVAEMGVKLHNANVGSTRADGSPLQIAEIALPDTGFSIEWDSPETQPSEKERIEAINLKTGISERQRLREYGYAEEDIDRILKEAEGDKRLVAEIEGQAFDAGQGPA